MLACVSKIDTATNQENSVCDICKRKLVMAQHLNKALYSGYRAEHACMALQKVGAAATAIIGKLSYSVVTAACVTAHESRQAGISLAAAADLLVFCSAGVCCCGRKRVPFCLLCWRGSTAGLCQLSHNFEKRHSL